MDWRRLAATWNQRKYPVSSHSSKGWIGGGWLQPGINESTQLHHIILSPFFSVTDLTERGIAGYEQEESQEVMSL
jgi:hypothetical protein